MADFTPKKFVDLEGLRAFYEKHKKQINNQISTVSNQISTVSGELDNHEAAAETAFTAIQDALNGYVLKVGEGIATMDDINEIIANANIAYTETALNIALDELNGEVV